MNISTIKMENGNVSCETPGGTVVHININQRSALDCLLDTFRFLRDLKKSGQKTKKSRTLGSAGHLGFGVAYISLGLVSVMLAIIICIIQPGLSIYFAGINFWVGFPFLVSGTLNLVAYKFPKTFWKALSFISLLVNFSVSIAGMVLIVSDIEGFNWFGYSGEICYNLHNGRGYYNSDYYGTTAPPRYDNGNDYYLERCKDAMQKYEDLLLGLTIMTLVVMIWGLCLAIFSVGFRVKKFCCSCKLERTEEKGALITSSPSDDIIIA